MVFFGISLAIGIALGITSETVSDWFPNAGTVVTFLVFVFGMIAYYIQNESKKTSDNNNVNLYKKIEEAKQENSQSRKEIYSRIESIEKEMGTRIDMMDKSNQISISRLDRDISLLNLHKDSAKERFEKIEDTLEKMREAIENMGKSIDTRMTKNHEILQELLLRSKPNSNHKNNDYMS